MASKKMNAVCLTGVRGCLTLAQPHREAIESFNFLEFHQEFLLMEAFGGVEDRTIRRANDIRLRIENTCRLGMGSKKNYGVTTKDITSIVRAMDTESTP